MSWEASHMKFSDLKKDTTYYCFERIFLDDAESYRLMRKQVTVLTPKTIEICTLNSRDQLSMRSRQRIYNPATATFSLYLTPHDAKLALINAIRQQLKSCEEKVRRLTVELNEALLLPTETP